MNEIKCPNCGEVFTVNESQYSELLAQVRTTEFDKEIHARIEQALALEKQKAQNEQQQALSQKESEIQELKATISNFESQKELIKKDMEQALSGKLSDKEKELVELQAQLDRLRLEHQNELQASLTNIEKIGRASCRERV